MVREENFTEAVIAHPDVGTPMLKVKASLRLEVCDQVLHLKRMWEAALLTQALHDASLPHEGVHS
eukprot:2538437-Alexandrium_andersonii.AAC.1